MNIMDEFWKDADKNWYKTVLAHHIVETGEKPFSVVFIYLDTL